MENQTDLLQTHIETHRGVMLTLGMIFGPFQGTSFTIITLNPNQIVDHCENSVIEGKTPSCASDDPMEQTDRSQLTWSEPQGGRTEQHQNNDLLQQMTTVCGCTKPGQTNARLICS